MPKKDVSRIGPNPSRKDIQSGKEVRRTSQEPNRLCRRRCGEQKHEKAGFQGLEEHFNLMLESFLAGGAVSVHHCEACMFSWCVERCHRLVVRAGLNVSWKAPTCALCNIFGCFSGSQFRCVFSSKEEDSLDTRAPSVSLVTNGSVMLVAHGHDAPVVFKHSGNKIEKDGKGGAMVSNGVDTCEVARCRFDNGCWRPLCPCSHSGRGRAAM